GRAHARTRVPMARGAGCGKRGADGVGREEGAFMTALHTRLTRLLFAAALFACVLPAGTAAPQDTGKAAQHGRWIAEMKEDPRGPFAAIKWFCKDGRVLPPDDSSCAGRGKGWQHGDWSDRTRQLRSQGYKVATLLAGMDAPKAVAAPD